MGRQWGTTTPMAQPWRVPPCNPRDKTVPQGMVNRHLGANHWCSSNRKSVDKPERDGYTCGEMSTSPFPRNTSFVVCLLSHVLGGNRRKRVCCRYVLQDTLGRRFTGGVVLLPTRRALFSKATSFAVCLRSRVFGGNRL